MIETLNGICNSLLYKAKRFERDTLMTCDANSSHKRTWFAIRK